MGFYLEFQIVQEALREGESATTQLEEVLAEGSGWGQPTTRLLVEGSCWASPTEGGKKEGSGGVPSLERCRELCACAKKLGQTRAELLLAAGSNLVEFLPWDVPGLGDQEVIKKAMEDTVKKAVCRYSRLDWRNQVCVERLCRVSSRVGLG